MTKVYPLLLLCLLCTVFSCKKEQPAAYTQQLPIGFPAMEIPEDNQLTDARIKLGKQLFFDKRLSIDSSVACASCHLPANAFSDIKALSAGVENRTDLRNSISLGNCGYNPYFFKDGGVPSLELQVLAPIGNHAEMAFSIPGVITRLSSDTAYQNMAQQAYGRSFTDYVLVRAIASFERTLVTGNSRYDQYTYQGKKSALNQNEINGMKLFFSTKADCGSCHAGTNLTDYRFANIGLYTVYADSGRARITANPADIGKFKTPSLRNIALTAPYMHDGSLANLEQVVEHFNSGGKGHFNQDSLVRPLGLSEQDKSDIVAFLNSLTDNDFINNTALRP